jgi:DNA mismatch repair protein MutL
MWRLDAPLALERFATSKIQQAADLEHIRTLGFRGEALSSIAAVARLELLTRAAGELEGTRVRTSTDLEPSPQVLPAASPVGTSVTVRELFYNTPARRKFLKSPRREAELVRNVVVRYALAYPGVALRLVVDGREHLAVPPALPLERIGACLGREIAAEMLKIAWSAGDLCLDGYISSPEVGRSRRQGQFFFLNGRPIRSGLLAVMLERPYAGRLPLGRHPLAVIHIQINPRLVDVNVHPRKAQVRLAQERAVYQALTSAVEETLSPFPRQEAFPAYAWPFGEETEERETLNEASPEYVLSGGLQALGQVLNTYLVARSLEGLVVVDQHAAHEQVLYEQVAAGAPPHPLSAPHRLSLTAQEAARLRPALPILSELGFDIEPFGGDDFILRALPAPIAQALAPTDLLLPALLTALEQLRDRDPESLREALAMKAACTAAVKAGDHLALDEQQALLDDLMRAWSPATCPHGRPAFITLTQEELERRFLRR